MAINIKKMFSVSFEGLMFLIFMNVYTTRKKIITANNIKATYLNEAEKFHS